MLFCIILAVILSIDSFGIGIAYGLKKISVPQKIRILISGASFVLSLLSVGVAFIFAGLTSGIIPENITDFISATIFFIIGIYMIISSLKPDLNYGDTDNSKDINPREAIGIGIAVSLDSFAIGLGIGLENNSYIAIMFPLFIFIMQYLFLSLGINLGDYFLKKIQTKGRFLTVLPGIILIILAILQLLN